MILPCALFPLTHTRGSRLLLTTEMEEDTEVLDWGNEDEEQQAYDSYRSQTARDDGEDAVSLGGDDDELQEFSAYQSRPEQDGERGQPPSTKPSSSSQPLPQQQSNQNDRELQRENSTSTQKSHSQPESPQLRRSQSLTTLKLTHALPPKPVLVAPPIVGPSPPQTSTLASSMIQRARRANGRSKDDPADNLPPGWEIRYPRNGARDPYYYNTQTNESTWIHPGTGGESPRKARTRSPRSFDERARSQEKPVIRGAKEGKRRPSPVGGLSYDDRHYRPGGVATGVDDRAPRAKSRSFDQDRRVTRSLTPPRRDNSRRNVSSRSPSPQSNAWRGRNPTPPRGRARNDAPPSPSLDTRVPRGRRQRADIEQPLPSQDDYPRRNTSREWSAHSTLSASSPPPTSRTLHLCSSRGGGHFGFDCLSTPRELSCATSTHVTTSFPDRLEDSHYGPIFFLHIVSSILSLSIPVLTSLPSLFALCRDQIAAAAAIIPACS
ncbi:hypothetical protein K474DRAFT_629625 [Panus rudis PR-1116 ss-1]|nr:hypothetical protein K474DRAFT_629625 [Panus rudis PR-1116 ss-1]